MVTMTLTIKEAEALRRTLHAAQHAEAEPRPDPALDRVERKLKSAVIDAVREHRERHAPRIHCRSE